MLESESFICLQARSVPALFLIERKGLQESSGRPSLPEEKSASAKASALSARPNPISEERTSRGQGALRFLSGAFLERMSERMANEKTLPVAASARNSSCLSAQQLNAGILTDRACGAAFLFQALRRRVKKTLPPSFMGILDAFFGRKSFRVNEGTNPL